MPFLGLWKAPIINNFRAAQTSLYCLTSAILFCKILSWEFEQIDYGRINWCFYYYLKNKRLPPERLFKLFKDIIKFCVLHLRFATRSTDPKISATPALFFHNSEVIQHNHNNHHCGTPELHNLPNSDETRPGKDILKQNFTFTQQKDLKSFWSMNVISRFSMSLPGRVLSIFSNIRQEG